MSYQGPYYGLDSQAEEFWLNNPTLAILAPAAAAASSTSPSAGSARVIKWERLVYRLLCLKFRGCLPTQANACRTIPRV